MSVCCECCVLSGRGLCDELITRPEKSYRLWCVVVCDLETSRMRRPWPALGRSATAKKKIKINILCVFSWNTEGVIARIFSLLFICNVCLPSLSFQKHNNHQFWTPPTPLHLVSCNSHLPSQPFPKKWLIIFSAVPFICTIVWFYVFRCVSLYTDKCYSEMLDCIKHRRTQNNVHLYSRWICYHH